MAAITIQANISKVMNDIAERIGKLKNQDYLLRPVAIETIANMKQRIHKDGKASDGKQIGTYSAAYMKVRTGDYANADRKKTGERKNSGYFTKGRNATFSVKTQKADAKRPNYHRDNNTMIVVSLTRQLENDWAVLATPTGYSIGFNNPFNGKKARWVEKGQKKKIFNLTEDERQYVTERLEELKNDALNS